MDQGKKKSVMTWSETAATMDKNMSTAGRLRTASRVKPWVNTTPDEFIHDGIHLLNNFIEKFGSLMELFADGVLKGNMI